LCARTNAYAEFDEITARKFRENEPEIRQERPLSAMTTIVMTGGTSGLGEVAARRLIQTPNTRLLLGARRAGPPGARTLSLDLMRLQNVRTFALALETELGSAQINALVLNAGALFPDDNTRSADGFEAAFAVNHLAHFLLLRLLLPRLAHGAVVILTTSSTHDPAEKTIVAPPLHADARLLAHPERDPDRQRQPFIAGQRAYSSSKLCNVLTARALAAHPDSTARRLSAIAYDPGHTPGTDLVRNENLAIKFLWKSLSAALRLTLRGSNSPEAAGECLAKLALGQTRPPSGRIYAALRSGTITWPEPSQLALRDDLRDALWRDSSALVDLTSAGCRGDRWSFAAPAPGPHGERQSRPTGRSQRGRSKNRAKKT
jgi:NAD(P)-dependent dehydrogenase (short-subunit alcohol dehydrogenase family)